jgi:hypothetical protein
MKLSWNAFVRDPFAARLAGERGVDYPPRVAACERGDPIAVHCFTRV